MREIEETLTIRKSKIDRHIQRLGLVKKLDIWIPHELKEIYCELLVIFILNAMNSIFFFNRIITGDEKWIVYNNVV